jgi:hypothetical protein
MGYTPLRVRWDDGRAAWKSCGNFNGNFFEFWIKKFKTLDDSITQAFSRDDIKSITSKTLKDITIKINEYNFLVSFYLCEKWRSQKCHMTNMNLSYELGNAQAVFVESFCVVLFSIYNIRGKAINHALRVDNLNFKSYKNNAKKRLMVLGPKVGNSMKRANVNFFYTERDFLSEQNNKKRKDKNEKNNKSLIQKLINQCRFKTSRKEYSRNFATSVWVPKTTTSGWKNINIRTIKQHVLHTIIYYAVHSIVEFQANPHTWGRPQRSRKGAVSWLTNRLMFLKKIPPKPPTLSKKSKTKNNCHYFCGPNIKIELKLKDYCAKKRRRLYQVFYWFGTSRKNKYKKIKDIYFYFTHLNINFEKSLETISFKSVLNIYPLCNKYKFLLYAWLQASIYRLVCSETKKTQKVLVNSEVPRDLFFGSSLRNCMLDGLEIFCLDYLYKTNQLLNKKKISLQTNILLPSCKKKNFFLRYASEIFILSNKHDSYFWMLGNNLVNFLSTRGLNHKELQSKINKTSSPELIFDFLGYHLILTSYQSTKNTTYPKNANQKKFSSYNNSIFLLRRKNSYFA